MLDMRSAWREIGLLGGQVRKAAPWPTIINSASERRIMYVVRCDCGRKQRERERDLQSNRARLTRPNDQCSLEADITIGNTPPSSSYCF
jgi:hypothetical protein